MKITKVEVVNTTKPIPLPSEYKVAWFEPDGKPVSSYGVGFYKVHTDEGIIGYGPYCGEPDTYVLQCLLGLDPFYVERFWSSCMLGREVTHNRPSYGGFDIALWDIIGKVSNLPVYKILGAHTDRMMVYAATSRLLTPMEHVEQVQEMMSQGFKAVKLRLHRPNHLDDLKVVEAVRKHCGDDLIIVVDCNQNHKAIHYEWWSRNTAMFMVRELHDLGVYFVEEPLERRDLEGLARLSAACNISIAGGEHSTNIFEFKDHIEKGSYDILQPDVTLGDIGITGIKKLAAISEYYHKSLIPHVCGLGSFALNFAATLQVAMAIRNCPMIEYPYDPPFQTVETQQFYLKKRFIVNNEGYVEAPNHPGLGIDIDEDAIASFL